MVSDRQLVAARRAARSGDAARVVAALAPDAPADFAVVKALGAACEGGLGDCVRVLLETGADPNCQVPSDKWWVQHERPLHAATQCLSSTGTQCMAVLLAGGADPLAVDGAGCVPLHGARSVARARLLLQAAPQAALVRDSNGRTPLQAVISLREYGVVRCLLAEAALQPVQDILDSLRQELEQLRRFAPRDASMQQHQQQTQQQLVALVPPLLEARLGLDLGSWYEDPSLCPNPWLAPALPAALERSEAAAGRLVRLLPPADRQRLRTAALSLGRAGRKASAPLPGPIVGRLLALGVAELPRSLAIYDEPYWFDHGGGFSLRVKWVLAFVQWVSVGAHLYACWCRYQELVAKQQMHHPALFTAWALALPAIVLVFEFIKPIQLD